MGPEVVFTLAVAVVGGILVLMLPPRYALVPLAVGLMAYPNNIFVVPTDIQMTPQRWMALLLLVRCILSAEIRAKFKWGPVDTMAVLYLAGVMFAQLMTQGPAGGAFKGGGFFLSIMAPFWCTRMLIVDRASFYALLKGWIWAGVPVAVLGVNQFVHGDNPYFQLMQNGYIYINAAKRLAIDATRTGDQRMIMGMWFFRACAPFMQCIMFGWFFALLVAPLTNLFWEKRTLLPWVFAWVLFPVGVLVSISGGPMMLAMVSFLMLFLFPFRHHWRSFVLVAATLFVAAMLVSRRSPLEVAANFGFDQTSSWYRVKLQNWTLHGGGMSGHWLAGYGLGIVPGQYDAVVCHDLCIHWVRVLVNAGLLGLVGFYGLAFTCASRLWQANKKGQSLEDQWLCWSLMCSFIASLMSMMVVALFMEMETIYHMFLALLANTPLLVGTTMRTVGVLAEMNGKTVLLRYSLKPGQQLALVQPTAANTRAAQAAVSKKRVSP